MQWFNWILRGGRKETLPEYFLDTPWLREQYPLESHARRVVRGLLEAGPLSERELRRLTGDQLDAYLRRLVGCLETHGQDWIRSHPADVRNCAPLVQPVAEPCPPSVQGGQPGGPAQRTGHPKPRAPRQPATLGSEK